MGDGYLLEVVSPMGDCLLLEYNDLLHGNTFLITNVCILWLSVEGNCFISVGESVQ